MQHTFHIMKEYASIISSLKNQFLNPMELSKNFEVRHVSPVLLRSGVYGNLINLYKDREIH